MVSIHSGRWFRFFILMMAAALLLAGCGSQVQETKPIEPKGKVYFTYFDTVSYIYDYSGDSAERFDDRSAETSLLLEEYHRLFDIYHEYAGINNLCTLNKKAGGEALPVDEKLIDFLLYAKEMENLTHGEMNVMLGAVLRLWHECREEASESPSKARIPTEEALYAASAHTSIDLLEIDPEKKTVRISDPEASIDVGALGKGYATEMAARMLEEKGALGYVLNIGGNIRIIGSRPDGTGWKTGIRNPSDPDGAFAMQIYISDTACVSSGVYERFFVAEGKRWHHIIDPDTLYPAATFSALTVITKDSGLADALSTALFCMDYEQSRSLVDSLDGVEVCWFFPDGEQRMTEGFSKLIVKE
ncbi:MAG: FAD:protein FMN transferase [Oscillospiraceae bacterium]|nr:FAD:protein FMN transferase [Oscillospiraceae bacterium]